MSLKEPTSRLVPKRPSQRYRYVRLRWHLLFALFDALGGLLFGIARLMRSVFIKENASEERPVQKILVIQLDHLGDAILSTGMLHVLRQKYPTARLDVLVGPWNQTLFETMIPDVDRVLVFESGGRLARIDSTRWLGPLRKIAWPLAMLRQGWRLRQEHYDLGIDVRGEMPHAAMMWIGRIQRRVGWNAGGGGFLLTDSPSWVPDRPEIESRGTILKAIGHDVKPKELLPRLNISAPSDLPSPLGNKYIVLHLTAGTRAKQWPVEHWGTLINELINTPSTEIVLVGSPADHIIGQKVEDLAKEKLATADHARLHNLIGRLSLVELGGVLQGAQWMIGADSGPAHMAAAVGTRTIVLFSGTNQSEQWRPPGDHVTVVRHEVPCRPCHQKETCPVEGHPCMTGITPLQVVEEIQRRGERREEN